MSDMDEALERYQTCKTGWGEVYEEARKDQMFYAGSQWEDDVVKYREGRPTLVTSHLQQFVHHVANEIRMNTPEIKVAPVNDGSNVDTAKIIQGMVKSDEKVSNANIAYDDGAENAIISSMGFIRLDHDFIAPDKLEQHILIKTVVNPLAVYIDPNSILPDGSDAKYGFVLDAISIEDFKRKYPSKDAVSFGDTKIADENVMIAEYFFLETVNVEIGLFENGEVLELSKALELKLPAPLKTRTMEKNTVRRQKLSGSDILEDGDFPGSFIPLVPVYGEIRWVDGKRQVWSLIRNAKDSQRMINYYNSLMVESLSKAPQAPFMGMVGQFETDPESWKNPHRSMVLQYDHLEINGGLAPAPQRLTPPPMPVGAYEAKMAAIEEMKAAMGLNDSNMGQPDNASSGLAIGRRQKQGETAVAHFADNLNRSICHVGKIWMSMKDEIYDTPRIVRIISPEGDIMHAQIGQGLEFDINAGKYDVSITSGPSFSSRREETYQMMLQIIQTNPNLMGVIGDLVFKYSDTPGADIISNRLKKTIPPQLLEGEDGQDQIPAQAQAQMQQMQQKIQEDQQLIQAATVKVQEMKQELDSCKAALDNKQGDLQLRGSELQTKTQMDAAKLELEKEKITTDRMKIQIEAQKAQTDQFKAQSDAQLKEAELQIQAQQSQQAPVQQQSQESYLNDSQSGNMVNLDNMTEEDLTMVLNRKRMEAEMAAAQAAKAEADRQEQIRIQQTNIQQQTQFAEAIVNAVNNLTTAINTPKQVVRGDDGRVIGVQ